MTIQQRTEWSIFREKLSTTISHEEYEMVARMHSELFKHTFYLPCKCNPREINRFIADINKKYLE